jgi:hypothetical protein
MADLTSWLEDIAGSFGTELGLSADDYASVVAFTCEALQIDSETSPLDSAQKAVGRMELWLYVMGLTTGSKDTFDRAKILYEQAASVASVYMPDISGLVKSVNFYDPYQATTDYDYV